MISVIVNVYNGEKYIKKCLKSIINQTYKDLEILIVNDGSTDKTLSICKSIKDKRIKIITTKNLGLSKSRNVGIDNSKGDYLFFVDADDIIEKDTIEYLYNIIKKNKTPIATCETQDIYDYDNYTKKIIDKEKIEIVGDREFLKKIFLLIGRNGTIWNKLIKRDLFDDIRFEDRIINDVVVVYKLILKAKKVTCSNLIKYYYYRHSDSIIGKNKPERSIDYYKAALERHNYIEKIYPDLIENDISMLWSIVTLYGHNNKEVNEFLDKEKAKEVFKKMFTLKAFTSKLKRGDKIKILLFRINPKLYIKILNKKYKR